MDTDIAGNCPVCSLVESLICIIVGRTYYLYWSLTSLLAGRHQKTRNFLYLDIQSYHYQNVKEPNFASHWLEITRYIRIKAFE